ncbi:MAG: 3-hydroxylacyl-ACP dehydratase [Gemmatimonadaceae bacterium]
MLEFPIEAQLVVPHSARMLLLDTVLNADENSLTAAGVVRADNPMNHGGAVGSWIGVEFMAQAIAAFEGCRARERGDSPKVGFLIGARHYKCTVPSFAVGAQLQIHVVRQYEEGGLGLFDGKITGTDFTADAAITVYQPDNAQEFLLETRA